MKFFHLLFVFFLALGGYAQDLCRVELDLSKVQHDRVMVRFELPSILMDTAIYQMPVIIPGTYAVANYGRYINELRAFDQNNQPLTHVRIDPNSWAIPPGAAYITYVVDDTFDDPSTSIFEPAGTDINEGELFLINMPGFVGYLRDSENIAYEVRIVHPENLYGATALERKKSASGLDVFFAPNYFHLHDNPILYTTPDTVSTFVGGTQIMIASASPRGELNSQYVMDAVQDLFVAAHSFLGDTLPTDFYLIINVAFDEFRMSYGALEHWRSTVMTLPDIREDWMLEELRNIVAHEFLHIITPLNIHSREIAHFNFHDPDMSKHLWLYEGVTEYLAHYVQLVGGMITLEEFVERMEQKILSDKNNYNPNVSFTSLSENCIDVYPDQYGNVYEKGALVAWLLDLQLRKVSGGQQGLADLLMDLSDDFGPEQPFNDEDLFEIITDRTHPEIRAFFARFVESAEPLPLEEYLDWIGLTYRRTVTVDEFSVLGNAGLRVGRGGLLEVSQIDELNEYGQRLGLELGDLILSINEIRVDFSNFEKLIPQIRGEMEVGQRMEIVVERRNKGKSESVILTAPAQKFPVEIENYMEWESAPQEEKRFMLKSWMENL